MIKKLKIKFIILAMTALFVLLSVIVAGMNVINYRSVIEEADSVLEILSQNQGRFPIDGGKPIGKAHPKFSPETPYESRYFTVTYNETGDVENTDVSKIASVSREEAQNYAESVMSLNKEHGFTDEYRYIRGNNIRGTYVIFLDCGRKLDAFHRFLISSIVISAFGFVIVFFAIFILSGRIIKPIAESYEKQKRFITDAGHEIKTPLTIINANVDILEMEIGADNESLADIKGQTKRLKNLTEDLVMLARMEESETNIQRIEFPISEVVSETANVFRKLASSEGKEFICKIEPMLTLNGNDKAIRQLVSIFLDNSLKYSQSGGTIEITLLKQNRAICLSVFNTTDFEVNNEQLKYVFDRFYRTDSSRNSETGGYGIGLSVAKAIVAAHGGKITASTKDGKSFTITVAFPL